MFGRHDALLPENLLSEFKPMSNKRFVCVWVVYLVVAELEKDGVANPEQVIKKRKIEERIESHMAENSQVEPEIRLKRFLYYGDERPLYQPGDRLDQTAEARLQIHRVQCLPKMFVMFKNQHEPPDEAETDDKKPSELEKPPKLEKPKKSEKSEGKPKKLENSEDKKAKKLEFEVNMNVVQYISSWGGGLRRLVCHWYEQQEPEQLARSVCTHSKQQGWSHKDLIRLSHLKAKDKSAGLQAVVCYVLHGLETAEKEFGQNEAAHDVMQELRRRKLQLEAEDFAAMAKLVEAHGLKYEAVPCEKLKDASVRTDGVRCNFVRGW
ncbi:hypothetical protein B566_EDAN014892, partial [Ephemera danica]